MAMPTPEARYFWPIAPLGEKLAWTLVTLVSVTGNPLSLANPSANGVPLPPTSRKESAARPAVITAAPAFFRPFGPPGALLHLLEGLKAAHGQKAEHDGHERA